MTNCDENGIRYGVISIHSLDPDVAQELWYGPQARDLSYEEAEEELRKEIERDAEAIEEEVKIASAELDYALLSNDNLMEARVAFVYSESVLTG